MNWNDNDNKKEIEKDKSFVACSEKYELETLAKKFNVSIDIVERCCKSIPSPHPRADVENCIKNYI